MGLKPYGIAVERVNGGRPLLAPTENWWESGVTFNTAAVYLERSAINDPLIKGLLGTDCLDAPEVKNGIVALHYRARPKEDPGYKWTRSFVGLALFTPGLTLIKRYADPIISPGERPGDADYLGVEDPRITRIGDTFYAVYCGVPDFAEGSNWKAANCMARSSDLLHWEKLGVIQGNVNAASNKDGVLFPDKIDGSYFLLHRPMIPGRADHSIDLGISDSLTGVWRDCGKILKPHKDPECSATWVGAGSVPIPLGERRYLVIFHTGNTLLSGGREYDLDAAIFNFHRFSAENPAGILEKRLDRLMVPETEWEVKAPFSDSVGNVVFTCGSYEFDGDIYILYGAGDSFILGARVRKDTLLESLETCPARS